MKQAILMKIEKNNKKQAKTMLSFCIAGGQLDRSEEKRQQNWLKNKIREDKSDLYLCGV